MSTPTTPAVPSRLSPTRPGIETTPISCIPAVRTGIACKLRFLLDWRCMIPGFSMI